MQRCLDLAKNGLGTTYPNPVVGCVIVGDQRIISEGWHHKAGARHAEAEAIGRLVNKRLLIGATLYVSLEPCNHYGLTPACSQLIVSSGIAKVVVGAMDPNPKVNGSGVAHLRDNGIEVITDILGEQARKINRRFFTFITEKRPYIILKWAETSNGFSAPLKKDMQRPVWITNAKARQHVHRLRAEEQAILIGSKTLRQDDPRLTAAQWTNNDPAVFVLGQADESDELLTLFKQTPRAKRITSDQWLSAPAIAQHLFQQDIQSVIVEGGTKTIQSFIDQGLWDECFIYRSQQTWTNGIESPKLDKVATDIIAYFDTDELHHAYGQPQPTTA
ncbi:MAG: hypothetical protein ABR84_02055 [Cryomorphaceae bacterium BACL21 MAG-121220-bin10]|jgi:diaminohydroxyphosphoribosylaminopyrimidine deaminase / 5-amino-6-(5-phosphoribosylamino)uracil reductase|nr:MAG: hypothetical protein ABR84_02055 [Cryomorphaceae bacterium BACL21 MAG-121220-bin10]|tara:strand:+ start:901 stop:1893 length:993 start_codon:yes stop_codon:yes gene_type:complete